MPPSALRTFRNLARNAVRPGYLPVLVRKAFRRLVNAVSWRPGEAEIRAWCRASATAGGWEEWAAARDPDLTQEASAYAARLDREARRLLERAGVSFDGAGSYPLLHFLVLWSRPRVVVETGVAVGYTSRAVLDALRRNGAGRLYSSDFPYFRRRRPEEMIGLLVPDELRDAWDLHLRGDRANLDRILDRVQRVDLFHYDSDKSYQGRRAAVERVRPYLGEGGLLVMDDISDDGFFRDLVTGADLAYDILPFEGRYVGIVRF